MKIRDVAPGTEVKIKGGPADGRVVRIIAKSTARRGEVGVRGTEHGAGTQLVRGDLEVESTT